MKMARLRDPLDPRDVRILCAQCGRILGWFSANTSGMVDTWQSLAEKAMQDGDVAKVRRLMLRIEFGVSGAKDGTITYEAGHGVRLRCFAERCTYERTVTQNRLSEETRRASDRRLGSVTFR